MRHTLQRYVMMEIYSMETDDLLTNLLLKMDGSAQAQGISKRVFEAKLSMSQLKNQVLMTSISSGF